MLKLNSQHTLNVAPTAFFEKLFFDPEFNHALYIGHLGMKAFNLERLEHLDDRIEKRVRVTPQQNAPAFVKKVFATELSYTEEGSWSRESGIYEFQTITSVASDKIHISGHLQLEQTGPNQSERTVDMAIEIRVPLLGGKLEGFVGGQLSSSFEKGAAFTNDWIRAKTL